MSCAAKRRGESERPQQRRTVTVAVVAEIDERIRRWRTDGPMSMDPREFAKGQQPTAFFVPGIAAQAWWPAPLPAELPWDVVRDEYVALQAQHSGATTTQLQRSGRWQQLHVMEDGAWSQAALAHCPQTVALLRRLRPCECALGQVYFSVLASEASIRPHYGATNAKLRMQLPLVLPGGSGSDLTTHRLEVGGEAREYELGVPLLFDDSFLHCVRGDGRTGGERVVLLADLWHPDLPPAAVDTIVNAFPPAANATPVEGEACVDELSDEVLLSIMAQLTPRDLGRSAQVCRRWRSASLSEALWSHMGAMQQLRWRFHDRMPDPMAVALVQSAPLPPAGAASWREHVAWQLQHSFGDEPQGPEYDRVLKLLMTGPAGAGKTSFLMRFTDNIDPDHQYIATIGIDFKIKTVGLKSERIKLQLWDTAGPERFRTITAAYYRGAHGIFIMFDVTDRYQFEDLGMWLENATRHAHEHCPRIIVGCKNDLRSSSSSSSRGAPGPRVVPYAEAEEFARSHGLTYLECSAKEGQSVEQAVHVLASSAQEFAIEKAARAEEESNAAQINIRDRASPSYCTVQ
jgi:small GTP-binding protein